jgi:hypothetical protein
MDNDEQYKTLASAYGGYEYDDYAWNYIALVQKLDDNRLFLYSDGGCSCNSPYETGWTNGLKPVHSVVEARQSGNDARSLKFNSQIDAQDWRDL